MPRLMVRFKEGTPSERIIALRESHAGVQDNRFDEIGKWRVIDFPDVETAYADYLNNPDVEIVQYEGTRELSFVPDDPTWPEQWNLQAPFYDLPSAWDITTGSPDVVVAVLDSGVTVLPDLTGRVIHLPGNNFAVRDAQGNPTTSTADTLSYLKGGSHGTQVAAIIAAAGNNATSVAGFAWQCRILDGVVALPDGTTPDAAIVEAIIWAADQGADILNCSFGGPGWSQPIADALQYAWDQGCFIVSSAGNKLAIDPDTAVCYLPAVYHRVLGVGSVDNGGSPSSTSRGVPSARTWAPGKAVAGVGMPGNPKTYDGMPIGGTSFAAPHVSGLAALIKSYQPTITSHRLWGILTTRAYASAAASITDTTTNGSLPLSPNNVTAQWQTAGDGSRYVRVSWTSRAPNFPPSLLYRNPTTVGDDLGSPKALHAWDGETGFNESLDYYEDTNIDPSKSYTYSVRSLSNYGLSDPSSTATAAAIYSAFDLASAFVAGAVSAAGVAGSSAGAAGNVTDRETVAGQSGSLVGVAGSVIEKEPITETIGVGSVSGVSGSVGEKEAALGGAGAAAGVVTVEVSMAGLMLVLDLASAFLENTASVSGFTGAESGVDGAATTTESASGFIGSESGAVGSVIEIECAAGGAGAACGAGDAKFARPRRPLRTAAVLARPEVTATSSRPTITAVNNRPRIT